MITDITTFNRTFTKYNDASSRTIREILSIMYFFKKKDNIIKELVSIDRHSVYWLDVQHCNNNLSNFFLLRRATVFIL